MLASGKNFSHRVYLGEGIYADLTLVYRKGDFRSLPWTYPDYGRPEMRAFLQRVRRKYIADLRGIPSSSEKWQPALHRAAGEP